MSSSQYSAEPSECPDKRVLMIAPTSFFADSGCHVRILEETRVLGRLGWQTAVCTYHAGRDLEGMDIRRTMPIPLRTGYEVGTARHKIVFDVLLFLQSMKTCISYRPDVIHAHLHEGALMGLVLSYLFRIPFIFDFQGSLTSEMVDNHFLARDGRCYPLLRRLERFINRHAQQIVTSSTHAAELVCSEFGCDPGRVTSIVDRVDLDAFTPCTSDDEQAALRQEWGIPQDKQVAVYLGKLAEYQGTGLLVKAVSRLCAVREDLHFVIAGYPYVEKYRELAAELGVSEHCTFTGRINYEKAADILRLGDIAVSPKVSKTEGAGKLLNYMAMGLPTVAFDNCVSREYLGDLGVYAPLGNVDALALQIQALFDDRPRRNELSRALRERATQFSWDDAGKMIIACYKAAANEKRGGTQTA